MDMNKGRIKAIYGELQGYLSQTPKPNSPTDIFATDSSWQRSNKPLRSYPK